MVNFMSIRLSRQPFQKKFKLIEGNNDQAYFSNVRWPTRGKMLERVHAFKEEITMFLDNKVQDKCYYHHPPWFVKLAFLVDITNHINTLNLELRRKNMVVFQMFAQITAFERKDILRESEFQKRNCCHFPGLQNHKGDVIQHTIEM